MVVPILIIASTVACDRSEKSEADNAVVTSCYVLDPGDQTPLQCFEYREDSKAVPKRERGCKELEGTTIFKTEACPSDKQVGYCVRSVAGVEIKEVAYHNLDSAKKRCSGSQGTFTAK